MSYFSALASSALNRGPNGEIIFFPWGCYGEGYIVPTETHAEAIRCFLRLYFKFALPSILAVIPLTGPAVARQIEACALLAALLTLAYWSEARKLVTGLPVSHTRYTLHARYRTAASQLPFTVLVPTLLFGAALLTNAVYLLVRDPSRWLIVMIIAPIATSFMVSATYMLRAKLWPAPGGRDLAARE